MRVTQNGVIDNLLSELNKNRSKYTNLSNQLASQKRVNRPSDDALAFGSGEEKKSIISRNEQYQSNLASGIEQAQIADDAIGRMLEQLFDLKTLTTKGANGAALTDSDMETLADNVAAIREKLVDLANTSANGRYIFAGTRTQAPAFTLSGNVATYEGNNQDLVIKANATTTVTITPSGENLFNYNSESVFELLNRIETAMRAEDASGVNAELENVNLAVEHLGRMGGRIGNAINQMEFAFEQFESTNITLRNQVSRLLDADYAQVASQIQTLDVAYQAALAVTSRISQLSLLNYL
jgi:flagellar hook-associated protein 3 FlgL